MKLVTYLPHLCVFFSSVVETSSDGNGYFMFADFWCAVYPREQKRVEFLVDWYFNKEFTMQYNSTVGNWTGFTPGGFVTASFLNEDKHDVFQRILERKLICVNNVGLVLNTTEENMAEPSISLQSVETTASSHDTLLMCSAYDFYPKNIRITWYQNGQEVTSGVTLSEVMTNGDWTYQVHSYLEHSSGRHDTVTCMVEHASLKEPKIYEWDSLNKSQRSSLIGGVVALVFGALFLSFGLVHYRRRKSCDLQFSNAL